MHIKASQVPAEPLSGHRLFYTRDIDRARHVVAQKFCDHRLLPGSEYRGFETCHNHAPGLNLSLNYLRYGSEVTIDPGELNKFYLIQIPLKGAARIKNGLTEFIATPKIASVLNATRATDMTWGQNCQKLLLQIDRIKLHQIAESLTGTHLPEAIVFEPEMRMDAPLIRDWFSKLRACVQIAENNGAFGRNIHSHQALIEEELISRLLHAQPSSISHMLEAKTALPCPKSVSLAQTYMMENLAEPITVKKVSEIADCSIRSLQLGFRRQFDCSPLSFLRRQRLNHAHYLLQTVPCDTPVNTVAYNVGFTHLGRFSIAYRTAFGITPSESLSKNQFR